MGVVERLIKRPATSITLLISLNQVLDDSTDETIEIIDNIVEEYKMRV
jgi:hypothetical protein